MSSSLSGERAHMFAPPNVSDRTFSDQPPSRPHASFILRSANMEATGVSLYTLHGDAWKPITEQKIFITSLLNAGFSFSLFIVSLLVITGAIEINGYAFVTAGGVVWIILTICFYIATWSWYTKPKYSHTHNQSIYATFLFWWLVSLFSFIAIGVWLNTKPDSECCSFSDSQPDRSPTSGSFEYAQYTAIFTFTGIAHLGMLYACGQALMACYYPEAFWTASSAYGVFTDNSKSK